MSTVGLAGPRRDGTHATKLGKRWFRTHTFGGSVSQCVIGEVGIDMSPFPSAGHFSAWAGFAPANNESGGKRKSAGTRKGAPHLRPILVQAAWAAVRVKGSYYGAMFRRLRSKGVASNVAIVAVARKMVEAIWHMLTNNTDFVDLGADFYENRKNPEIETRRLVKKLLRIWATTLLSRR